MTAGKKPLLILAITIATLATTGCICCNISENVNAIKQAVTNRNAERCDKMEDPLRCACYTSVAISTENLEICNKIDEEDMRIGCYISMAVEKEDAEICDKIKNPDARNTCITQTAERTKNPELCNKITQPTRRGECLMGANESNQ